MQRLLKAFAYSEKLFEEAMKFLEFTEENTYE